MADSWPTTNDTSAPAKDDWETSLASLNVDDKGSDASDTGAPPKEDYDPRAGNEEYEKMVQERGWVPTSTHDYEAFNARGTDHADWHAMAPRYEWNDEYGEVGPRNEELEHDLFGGEFRMRTGTNIDALQDFHFDIEGKSSIEPIRSFSEAGLHPVMLENIELCGYTKPTPIQAYCIPVGLQGIDMIAVAQTGSGKTAAYMIPVISRLMGKARKLCAPKPDRNAVGYNPKLNKIRAEPLVIVVVPARELAIQIYDEARRMCYRSMLRPVVAYGGLPYVHNLEDLGKGCDILIATPGRLTDLMDRPDVLTMRRVKYTIIDEADELLSADWEEELRKIMSGGDTNTNADHVFMLFSATFPKATVELANECLSVDRFVIKIGRAGSSHKNIKQDVIWVDPDRKLDAIWDLIMASETQRTLIFCNSRPTVDNVDDYLYNRGLPTTSIHSQRNQREREDALRAFRTGRCPILIATGISARGWDIKGIGHVINYDLPSTGYGGIDEYVHRIGRTARIGNTGLATSFYNDRNEDIAKALVSTLIECNCPVPDFLNEFKHEDGKPHFEEDEEDNQSEEQADNVDGFEDGFEDATEAAEHSEGIAISA